MRAKLEANTEGYVALQSFCTGVRAALEGFRYNTATGATVARELPRVRREEP